MVPPGNEKQRLPAGYLYRKPEVLFSYNDREGFFRCMEQLKKSGIVVNKETMELIRLFQG